MQQTEIATTTIAPETRLAEQESQTLAISFVIPVMNEEDKILVPCMKNYRHSLRS